MFIRDCTDKIDCKVCRQIGQTIGALIVCAIGVFIVHLSRTKSHGERANWYSNYTKTKNKTRNFPPVDYVCMYICVRCQPEVQAELWSRGWRKSIGERIIDSNYWLKMDVKRRIVGHDWLTEAWHYRYMYIIECVDSVQPSSSLDSRNTIDECLGLI